MFKILSNKTIFDLDEYNLKKNIKIKYYNDLNSEEFIPNEYIQEKCYLEYNDKLLYKIKELGKTYIVRNYASKINYYNKTKLNQLLNINWIYPIDKMFLILFNDSSFIIGAEKIFQCIEYIFSKIINNININIISLFDTDNFDEISDPILIISDVYFVNFNNTFNKINGGIIFNSEFTNCMTEFVKNKNKKSKLDDLTYGNFDYERIVDLNVRTCKILNSKIIINYHLPNLSNDIYIGDSWEYLEYDDGGFFTIHRDRKRNKYHKYTVLVYPPINLINSIDSYFPDNLNISEIYGGELILYPFESNEFTINLKMNFNKWISIIFPIDIPHESIKIKGSGKSLFKGVGMCNL
jgi:hypothetical protein